MDWLLLVLVILAMVASCVTIVFVRRLSREPAPFLPAAQASEPPRTVSPAVTHHPEQVIRLVLDVDRAPATAPPVDTASQAAIDVLDRAMEYASAAGLASPALLTERAMRSIAQAISGGSWSGAHDHMRQAFDSGGRDPHLLIEMARCLSPAAAPPCRAEFEGLTFESALAQVEAATPDRSALAQLVAAEQGIADPRSPTPERCALVWALAQRRAEFRPLMLAMAASLLVEDARGPSRLHTAALQALRDDPAEPVTATALLLAVTRPGDVGEPNLARLLAAVVGDAEFGTAGAPTAPHFLESAARSLAQRLRPLHGLTTVGLPVEPDTALIVNAALLP